MDYKQEDYKNEYHDAFSLDIDGENIYKFCKTFNCQVPILFLSATILNLNKYLKSDKIMFFTVFNGRYSPRLNNTVGCLAKSLLFNSDTSDKNKTLNQFFNEIQKTQLTLLSFEPNNFIYDYSKIENEFEFNYVKANNSDSGPTDIIMEDCPGNAVRDNTLFYVVDYDYIRIHIYARIKDNTLFYVIDYGNKITLNIFYKGHIYSEEYISAFLNSIVELIQNIIKHNPDKINISEHL